ncbi:proline dehydrogenase [Rhizomicrobium palustre]|uniref:Proline dehydrogenase n=1 Tax=Rhizomicrobium palustre TaxID=189966 RepID=A0A846MVZ8_9PROT|nr:hypothetical protein [Rhizomicrobium palustre]NIK87252.1 proline dehydrogenase [Rhizomicrobium palustre]
MADTALFDTAPPPVPLKQRLKHVAIVKTSALLMPLIKKAAAPYAGGETITDALAVATRLAHEGHATTLGFWDAGEEADILAPYRAAITALRDVPFESYISLKPPALRFSPELAHTLAREVAPAGLRLHSDSHGVEVADRSNAFTEALLGVLPPENVSTTLPGRWQRSLGDADWAMSKNLAVRVVKGQWPDPADPHRDIASGYLAVIDRLAQGARHVAVATHDLELARASIKRLKAARVSCEIEILLGMPAKPLLAWAKAGGVPVRVYVPYGPGFVPNAIGVLRRNPRILLAVAKERARAIAGLFGAAA